MYNCDIKLCMCGNPATWENIDGHYEYVCESCLDKRGYRYCDNCNEWKKDVKHVEDLDLVLCGDCEKYGTY